MGRRIARVWRRGKYIVMQLEASGALLIHLRMSGRLEAAAGDAGEPRHTRAVFEFDDGLRLHFCDARRFGRIVLARDVESGTGGLGPEPLSDGFSALRLGRLLAGRRRQVKPLLLDQRVIAGLGNIYTDEALFRAGIHPLEPSDRIDGARVKRLHAAIRTVLKEGIRRNGASIDWVYPGGNMQESFRVYGRAGQACVTCGATIEYLRVGQRGTHVCPRCQRLG
ncbi:MAG: Formamidopyrimidine-DNA glycosylase [Phycisphaerae bacterium]|nr:Formamidopyrimidine-DNA glycosylase [Phycisphaerae bacterium]